MRLLTAAFLALCAMPAAAAELEIPEDGYVVSDDLSLLPQAVREKRAAVIAAARSGDLDVLRDLFETELSMPIVSFGEPEDPIAYLKEQSGDGTGYRILALLADIMTMPYAAIDGGDGDPIFIWPYHAAMDDLSALTPAEQTDALRVVAPDELKELMELGAWYSWRASMTVRGDLQAFVAGD